MEGLKKFQELEKIFHEAGFHLYLTGGAVRDYLLSRPSGDLDMTSDATPEEMEQFLLGADHSFARFGMMRYKMDGVHLEITTLRKEGEYLDFRHPNQVKFVKSPKEDCLRRDFTINGLYLTSSLEVLDYVGGIRDLSEHKIRTIGDPFVRFYEDPLRILRAVRFSLQLHFTIEEKTKEAMLFHKDKLSYLRKEKILEEVRKIKKLDEIEWDKWKVLLKLEEL